MSDNPSLSDHAMITFHFTIAKPAEQWYRNVRKTNWKDYKDNTLPSEAQKLFPLRELNSPRELDSKAEEFTKCIMDAYKKSCPLKRAGNKNKPNPWWNENLKSLRRETRRLERKAKRSNQNADWDLFKESRKALKSEIRKSKRQSWRDLCERTEGLSPLARLYKILKWDSNSQLGSIEKPDGSFTNSPEETLQCMLDVHLSDPELPDPGAEVLDHGPILSGLEEVIVTGEKAKFAVDQFKPYKSPGGEGVYPILLQQGWETIEPVFLMICRASIKLGYIPKIW